MPRQKMGPWQAQKSTALRPYLSRCLYKKTRATGVVLQPLVDALRDVVTGRQVVRAEGKRVRNPMCAAEWL
jgi:hypothetical protein